MLFKIPWFEDCFSVIWEQVKHERGRELGLFFPVVQDDAVVLSE